MNFRLAKSCLLIFFTWSITCSCGMAQESLWGMSYGNAFGVETTIDRHTKLKLNGGPESIHHSKETVVVNYRVVASQPRELVLQAIVISLERTTDPKHRSLDQLAGQQMGLIPGLRVNLVVDPDGVITAVDRKNAAAGVLNGSAQSRPLMDACCSDRVVGSWFARPFWFSLQPEKWKTDAAWDHTDEIGLGLMGRLINIVNLKITGVKDDSAEVLISGTGRHAPLAEQLLQDLSLLQLSDMTASVEEFSGSAKMIRPSEADLETRLPENRNNANPLRPLFDALSLDWKITGEATVSIGETKRAVAFEQKRTERSRLLPGYRFGRPRIMFPPAR